MAHYAVGTTPIQIPVSGRARPLIQNLGPGIVYFDTDGEVDASTGFQLPVGGGYEYPMSASDDPGGLWLVATAANTDVRIVMVG